MTDNRSASTRYANDHQQAAPQFRFWSLGEVSRIGAVMGVLAVPFAAIGNGNDGSADLATAPSAQTEPSSTGRLRAVRLTPLDVGNLANAHLADRED
jgi:hypothetical protein